ncbi:hypothetical protein [Microvirga splendida]|uniref:Stereocilin n=1 Tax=Microvirga splendida TaxID=2795727 RepID=A0ABS0Y3V2_9HYPH|nr:hypothetical protein [Microvirga splendida]MBJ6126984.1 hypothetical protein [Microvirga splendida]
MSDTPKPPDQPPDIPGPLPELPSLDPVEPTENDRPSDERPDPTDVPYVPPPGTQ